MLTFGTTPTCIASHSCELLCIRIHPYPVKQQAGTGGCQQYNVLQIWSDCPILSGVRYDTWLLGRLTCIDLTPLPLAGDHPR